MLTEKLALAEQWQFFKTRVFERSESEVEEIDMIQLSLCIAEEAGACGKIFLHTFLISKKYVPARHEGIER